MYRIYNTEAVVLSGSPTSEGSRTFSLLTEDFGLIQAHAEGVRKSASKFRHALQTFSLVSVSLVRGRGKFRIIHANTTSSYREIMKSVPGALSLCGRISWLLRRMIPEEEKNRAVYLSVKEFFLLLPKMQEEQFPLLEIAAVMRILSALGYFPARSEYHTLFEGDISLVLPRIKDLRKNIIADINTALVDSHL
ncbi:MAG: DNA repair protein RecO [Patescibacteria group bacterium]